MAGGDDQAQRRRKTSKDRRRSGSDRRHKGKGRRRSSKKPHDPIDSLQMMSQELLQGDYDDHKDIPQEVANLLAEKRDFTQTRMLAKLTTDLCRLLLVDKYSASEYAQTSAFATLSNGVPDRPLADAFHHYSLEFFKERMRKIGVKLKKLTEMCFLSFEDDTNNISRSHSPLVALDVALPVLSFDYGSGASATVKKRTAETKAGGSRKKRATNTTTIKSSNVVNTTVTTSSTIPIQTRELPLTVLKILFERFEKALAGSEKKQNNTFELRMLEASYDLEQATSERETQSSFVSVLKACFRVVRYWQNLKVTESSGIGGRSQDFLISIKSDTLVCGEVKTSIGDNIAAFCCDHDSCPYVKWSQEFHNLFVRLVGSKDQRKVLKGVQKSIEERLERIEKSSTELGNVLRAMFQDNNRDYKDLEEAIASDVEKYLSTDPSDPEVSTVHLDKWLQKVFTRPCNIGDRAGDRHSTRSLTSQVFGYMVSNKTHFGIVTDYDRTAFCITDRSGRMYISECISNSTVGFYTVPQAIVMFCMLAYSCTKEVGVPDLASVTEVLSGEGFDGFDGFDEYNLPPSCDRIPKNGAPIMEDKGYSSNTNSTNRTTSVTSIRFGDDVGYGRTGDAHIAEYDGERGVLKMVNKLDNPSMQDEIGWETYVYERLKDLQGAVLPKVLRSGRFKEWYVDGLLTSYMGRSLAQIRESNEKLIDYRKLLKKAKAALAEVHRRGFLHGDIKPENIVLDDKMNPILIDFGNARKLSADDADATSKTRYEMDRLTSMILDLDCE